jgi:putative Mg2+ transporter-C (MgtC) family protein
MPLTLGWQDIALRLILTIVAGTLIGINRGEHGRPAGLRTTLLVCLAASIAMIQTNLLLATAGKPEDSFVTIDLMRLPLGILSGMGFIGGGAILKRDNIVLGVTTAATLWYVTVLGLCFGGGQIILGSTALAIGMVVLWGLKWLEQILPQSRQATLTLTVGPGGPTEEDFRRSVLAEGFRIVSLGVVYDIVEGRSKILCEVRWWARPAETQEPSFLKGLARLPGVSRLEWSPQNLQTGLV